MAAQRDLQSNHLFYDQLSVNPGYTGVPGQPEVLAFARQSSGGEEALSLYGARVHGRSANGRVGLGVAITQFKAFDYSYFTASLLYAYHVRLSAKQTLSIGLAASANQYTIPVQAGGVFEPPFVFFRGNAGVGITYYTDDSYVYASVPSLLDDNIDDAFTELGQPLRVATFDRITYVGAGTTLRRRGAELEYRPHAQVAFTPSGDVAVSAGVQTVWPSGFSLSGSYRRGELPDALALNTLNVGLQIRLKNGLLLGGSANVWLGAFAGPASNGAEAFGRYRWGEHFSAYSASQPEF